MPIYVEVIDDSEGFRDDAKSSMMRTGSFNGAY